MLTAVSAARLGLEAGAPVWLGVKAAAVHLVARGFPPFQ